MYGFALKMLIYAYFLASRGSALHPGWGSRPDPDCASGARDGPFTVTPAMYILEFRQYDLAATR